MMRLRQRQRIVLGVHATHMSGSLDDGRIICHFYSGMKIAINVHLNRKKSLGSGVRRESKRRIEADLRGESERRIETELKIGTKSRENKNPKENFDGKNELKINEFLRIEGKTVYRSGQKYGKKEEEEERKRNLRKEQKGENESTKRFLR